MNERNLYRVFEFTILAKGFFACVDLLTAGLLYFFGTTQLTRVFVAFAQGELLEDPGDVLAQFFLQHAPSFSPDLTTFAILYLLTHGIINAVFVIGLWRDRRWAYPFAIIALVFFMTYQLYRLVSVFSLWLTLLTIVDIFTIWIIWHEFRYRTKKDLLV